MKSEEYREYLISNIDTILNYVKVTEQNFNPSILLELANDISTQEDSNKLDFYAENLDRLISNLSYEFGYNHSREYKRVL